MKEIGGYFELELNKRKDRFLHSTGILLNSGRHALEYILLSIKQKPNKIWLPYYTCDSILHPIKRLNINFDFYHIDINLLPEQLPEKRNNELILINNYFGLLDKFTFKITQENSNNLIIDQTQAWFASEQKDVKSFYSPRKFFGVPDGGIAFGVGKEMEESFDTDVSWTRFAHLLKRHELLASDGYDDFRRNSGILKDLGILKMSQLTKKLLSSIDMNFVKKRRIKNYTILHEKLKNSNQLKLPSIDSFSCPMIYPYCTDNLELRKKLIENKIYIATYWSNIFEWCSPNSIEYYFAKNLIPLPIDQRYGVKEMNYIIRLITQ